MAIHKIDYEVGSPHGSVISNGEVSPPFLNNEPVRQVSLPTLIEEAKAVVEVAEVILPLVAAAEKIAVDVVEDIIAKVEPGPVVEAPVVEAPVVEAPVVEVVAASPEPKKGKRAKDKKSDSETPAESPVAEQA